MALHLKEHIPLSAFSCGEFKSVKDNVTEVTVGIDTTKMPVLSKLGFKSL